MSFALSMRSVPYSLDYAGAVAIFNRAVPWRNGGDDRPLPNKRTRNMGVRMNGDDVVFRYHRTDVIRWKPDGSYELDTGGYNTRSTCEFATHFMPHRHRLSGETAHLRIEDKVYPMVGQQATVSRTGDVSGPGIGRFEERTVNRKKARTMLKEMGYYEYLAWHKLMYPMVRDTMPPSWRRRYMSEDEAAGALKVGQDAYHDLMMAMGGEPDTVRDKLYAAYGDRHGIWDVTYHDSLSYTANLRRYKLVSKEKK
jgi:hypothetical protein